MLGEDRGIGHVGDAIPLHGAAGKNERDVQVLAERGLRREGEPHVHQVADGVPDDGVRAVHRPGETLALSGREELVFLRVVEVGHVEAGLVLTERGVGHRALSVGLERAEVVLESGDESHVLDGCVIEGGKKVAHHTGVDLDVELLGLLAGPCGEKDLLGLLSTEYTTQVVGGAEVGLDPAHTGGFASGTTGERNDLPTLGRKLVNDGGSGDSGCSNNQCCAGGVRLGRLGRLGNGRGMGRNRHRGVQQASE